MIKTIFLTPVTLRFVLVVVGLILIFPHASVASGESAYIDLEFNENDHLYVSDNDQSGLDITGDFTLEAWIKLESIPGMTQDMVVVSKYDSSGPGTEKGYNFAIGESNKLTLYLSSDGVTHTKKQVTWSPEIGVWKHVGVKYMSSSGEAVFFVDGLQQGSVQAGLPNFVHSNSAGVGIGVRGVGGVLSDHFDGSLDAIKIWSISKDPNPVENLEGDEVGLEAFWQFSDLSDETSNANSLINAGAEFIEITTETPDGLVQRRVDGQTEVGDGEAFVGNGVVLSGEVGVDEEGVLRGIEVEVKPLGESFDGVGTRVSDLGTEAVASVVVTDLFSKADLYGGNNQADFTWRARTVDENGGESDWVEFGGPEADFTLIAVPLVTQVTSSHPNASTTAGWASAVYAEGRADSTGNCGRTIESCGCVLSSLSTLGYHHNITTGIDGSAVNPKNLNDWLLENNGYTGAGSIIWPEAMKYFGTKVSEDEYKTHFSFKHHNATDTSLINNKLVNLEPVIAFSLPQGYRHYYVIDSLLDSGYEMSDPHWFNTLWSDEGRDLANDVQDYDNDYSAAQIIDVSNETVAFEPMIEVHLASPAELVVRDQEGRRVGYNPRRNRGYDEIPGGQYDRETSLYAGNEERDDEAHEFKVVRIFGAEVGEYDVSVIGTDRGEYLLSIYTIDELGNSNLIEYTGKIRNNKKTKYQFEFSGDLNDEDDNRGHGNDEDGCDDDNPGKKKSCRGD